MRVEIEMNPENRVARMTVDGNLAFVVMRNDDPDRDGWHGHWRANSDPRIDVDGLIQVRDGIDILLEHMRGQVDDETEVTAKNRQNQLQEQALSLLRAYNESAGRLADAVAEMPKAISMAVQRKPRAGRKGRG